MRKTKTSFWYIFMYASAIISLLTIAGLVGYIIVNGISKVSFHFLTANYTVDGTGGIWPMLVTTLYVIGVSLLIAVPIGVCCAIYLVEYAKRGSKFVKIVRFAAESLSGIPSILFGLFGYMFFSRFCGFGWSILSGSLTLCIMVLPTIIRSTEEALKSVPDSYREASYGLGAGSLRTIFRVVLPSAMPGIIAAIILSIGRIVGESAALMLTLGTATQMPTGLLSTGRTLSVHMYMLAKEGLDMNAAFATAFILLVTVLIINILATVLMKKAKRG